MKRYGGRSLIVVAIVLIVTGLFMRWDLVDWLIDAVGLVFIAGGVIAGLLGLFGAISGRREQQQSL